MGFFDYLKKVASPFVSLGRKVVDFGRGAWNGVKSVGMKIYNALPAPLKTVVKTLYDNSPAKMLVDKIDNVADIADKVVRFGENAVKR